MIGPEHKVTFTEVGKPKENRVGKEEWVIRSSILGKFLIDCYISS